MYCCCYQACVQDVPYTRIMYPYSRGYRRIRRRRRNILFSQVYMHTTPNQRLLEPYVNGKYMRDCMIQCVYTNECIYRHRPLKFMKIKYFNIYTIYIPYLLHTLRELASLYLQKIFRC